jgi:hypothetical protein
MARPKNPLVSTGYAVWATEGRNATLTAEKLGVSRQTVDYWRHNYGWDEQYEEDAESALRRAFLAVEGGLSAAAIRLVQIVENPDSGDREAIQAAKALFELVGARQAIQKGTQGDQTTFVDKMLVQQLGNLPTDQLMLEAAKLLEGNIHDAQNIRASKRQAIPKP